MLFNAKHAIILLVNSVLTVRCKLKPTVSQAQVFERTADAFTAACNYVLRIARETDTFNRFQLHKLAYADIREQFNLPANLAVTVFERVGKRKGKKTGGFKRGSVSHNARTVSLKGDVLSILTVDGRLKVPLAIGEYQRRLLPQKVTDSKIRGGTLVRGKNGKWYAHLWVSVENAPPKPPIGGAIGVDLGITNIATTSDGEVFTGSEVEQKRQKCLRHRSSLQKCGSRSAKRRLEKISERETRFRSDTNHVIAKSVVDNAKRTERGIKLENLQGIGQRTRVRRQDRAKHAGWAFYQLRQYITYRCVRDGVALATVDPRNTSRMCSKCGHCEKANRKSQAEFVCKACGYTALADVNAAVNIARASVKTPIVDGFDANQGQDVPDLQAVCFN